MKFESVNQAIEALNKHQATMAAYNIDSSTGQMKRLTQMCDVNAIAQDLAKAVKAMEQ